jgi:hypothetical protein
MKLTHSDFYYKDKDTINIFVFFWSCCSIWTYTKHRQIVVKYVKDVKEYEYLLEVGESEIIKNKSIDVEIARVSDSTNITVLAFLLVSEEFLRDTSMTTEEVNELLHLNH